MRLLTDNFLPGGESPQLNTKESNMKITNEVSTEVVLDDTLTPQPCVEQRSLGWAFDRSDLEKALEGYEWGKTLATLWVGGPVVFSACMGEQPCQATPGNSAWARVSAKSERSLIDTVNHNCVIVGAALHRKYGLIIEFKKRSTGHRFNFDLPMRFRRVEGFDTDTSVANPDYDAEGLVISQGKSFSRFHAPAKVLDNLAPSTKGIIEHLGKALDGALIHWNGEMSFQLDAGYFCGQVCSPLYK